jgi:hypothetical protein
VYHLIALKYAMPCLQRQTQQLSYSDWLVFLDGFVSGGLTPIVVVSTGE